jgi:carboxypeptidase Taq
MRKNLLNSVFGSIDIRMEANMSMDNYKKLEHKLEEINRFKEISSILHWDRSVIMPLGASGSRGEHMAVIDAQIRELIKKLGTIIEKIDRSDLDPWQRRNVDLAEKMYIDTTIIPGALEKRFLRAVNEANVVWRKARAESNFQLFQPYLEEIVDVSRETSELLGKHYGKSSYDALLDKHDPGLTSAMVDKVFGLLEVELPGLVEAVVERQREEEWHKHKFPKHTYDIATQERMGKRFMDLLGFDFNRGALGISTHPFCGGYTDDVRITSRYTEDEFISGLLGVLHETGHALYEQNRPQDYKLQPVGANAGMAVHESQSLFVEMQIARSREFIEFAHNIISEYFDIKGVTTKGMYHVINKVGPSFIRVDADEVTYPLHVILRYHIEKDLIAGTLKVADVPEKWNQLMEKYLGITPANNAEGCLQDIHWSLGEFGYFPSYTFGALISAQLAEAIREEHPDFDELIAKGNFRDAMDILKHKVHSQGSLHESANKLLLRATDKELDPECFLRYVKRKYLES